MKRISPRVVTLRGLPLTARWFGAADSDLPLVLPNLGRFAAPDLGFLG